MRDSEVRNKKEAFTTLLSKHSSGSYSNPCSSGSVIRKMSKESNSYEQAVL